MTEGRGAPGVRSHFWIPAEDIDICGSFSRWGFVLEEIKLVSSRFRSVLIMCWCEVEKGAGYSHLGLASRLQL